MTDAAASRHFFDDLASQNEARSSTFEGELTAGKRAATEHTALNSLQRAAWCGKMLLCASLLLHKATYFCIRMVGQSRIKTGSPIAAGGVLCPSLPPGTSASLARGTQKVSKGRQGPLAANDVQVRDACRC